MTHAERERVENITFLFPLLCLFFPAVLRPTPLDAGLPLSGAAPADAAPAHPPAAPGPAAPRAAAGPAPGTLGLVSRGSRDRGAATDATSRRLRRAHGTAGAAAAAAAASATASTTSSSGWRRCRCRTWRRLHPPSDRRLLPHVRLLLRSDVGAAAVKDPGSGRGGAAGGWNDAA